MIWDYIPQCLQKHNYTKEGHKVLAHIVLGKLTECCVWCWSHNCQKVTSKRKMQGNESIIWAMENSDVLTIDAYLKRLRREKIFRRILSRAKTRI